MRDPLQVTLMRYGRLSIERILYAKAGDRCTTHKHEYPHITACMIGSVSAQVEGYKARVFHAPQCMIIPAGILHTFTALEDGTLLHCIHASPFGSREEVADIFDPANVIALEKE